MGGLEWWHWVIIGLAFLLIFGGYKKLPSATKSIAQSLKIFKDETKGLRGEDDEPAAGDTATQHPQHDNAGALAAPQLSAPVPQPVAPASVPPVEQPVVPQPVAQQPVAQQPVAQQPVAPQPVVVAAPAPLAPASLAPQPGAYAGKRQSS